MQQQPPSRKINVSQEQYVFVSYSHKDGQIVYEDINKLLDQSLNCWFDVELNAGDEWDKTVKSIIENENCRGAIICMSRSSFKSEAVEKEIKALYKKKQADPSFTIVLVSPYHSSVMEIIRDIFLEAEHYSAHELETVFPQSRLTTIVENLTSNTLYVSPDENDHHIEKIISAFKSKKLPVFSDSGSLLDKYKGKLDFSKDKDSLEIYLGDYPAGECDEIFTESSGYTSKDGKNYYTDKGKTFVCKPITWKILALEDTQITLCPDQALCFDIINKIEETVSEGFEKIAFREKQDAVLGVSLPNVSQLPLIEKVLGGTGVKISSFAKSKAPAFLPDILFFKDGEKMSLYNKSLKKMNVPIRSNTAGFALPIVTLDLSKL